LIDLCLGSPGTEPWGGVDLRTLAGLAARLNVESYVLETLGSRQQRLPAEPERWLAELRQKVFAVAVDNLRRDEELREALGRLDEEGVPFILLKGSALRAERPGLTGRFQCDLDLLVRRQDLERAEGVLSRLGFTLDESRLGREDLLSDHFHLAYQRHGAMVELHWDIDVTSPAGFAARLWERRRQVELDGRTFHVLAPEHQLLVACLHLSRHAFCAGLRWLADLKLLLPAARDVRERFTAEARGWPRRAVYSPLWMLACHGVPGSGELAGGFGAGPAERRLLQPLLTALLLDEPWLGLPAWRGGKAVHAWLYSERSLVGLLSAAWRRGLRRRWQAAATGAA
jgi:putative nucleotidyltransferase-like protein